MSDLISVARDLWATLPSPVAGLIVLCGGWLIAKLFRFLVARFLVLVRFDTMGEKTGFSEFLRKGNAKYTPSRLAGVLAYWIVLVITFLETVRIVAPEIHRALAEQLANALPSLVAAALIIVVGLLLTSFLANFILTIALNASIPHARPLSTAVRYLGAIIVITLALEQAGIGRNIVETLFLLLFGAAALGVAIAFGLGCKDMARDALKRFLSDLREREREGKGGDLEG
jgi:hypothetical protein